MGLTVEQLNSIKRKEIMVLLQSGKSKSDVINTHGYSKYLAGSVQNKFSLKVNVVIKISKAAKKKASLFFSWEMIPRKDIFGIGLGIN